MKTYDLTGNALDWAVAKCVGRGYPYPASTDWSIGGPIIDRERIALMHVLKDDPNPLPDGDTWSATVSSSDYFYTGKTSLIAAMRCFCALKLGDEIDIPEELL